MTTRDILMLDKIKLKGFDDKVFHTVQADVSWDITLVISRNIHNVTSVVFIDLHGMNLVEAFTRIKNGIFNRLRTGDTLIVEMKISNETEKRLIDLRYSVWDNLRDFYEKNFDKE